MNRLIMQAAQQYSPQDRERFVQYVRQDPMAAAQLRAPLYEDKVVDFLFEKAEVTDRTVSREELEAAIEAEDGDLKPHVHGPGCGHDHHDEKPKAKKAAPKKKAEAEEAAPAAETVEEAPAKKAPAKKAAAKKDEAVKDEAGADEAAAEEKPKAKKAPAKKAAAKAE
jgi:trigger factor